MLVWEECRGETDLMYECEIETKRSTTSAKQKEKQEGFEVK